MPRREMSVVIGFRDWGAERIRRSARSIQDAFGDLDGEIIISDYGSTSPESVEDISARLGLKYVYTPGDPVWSRSRALNAGFARAEGDVLVSTDADMLFTPQSMRRVKEILDQSRESAVFLQCRDLPESMGDQYFESNPRVDWGVLEQNSRLRPRWGMGGMMAISREGFARIRGFDERLHTYGGEDLDFAKRARRAGYRTVWIDDPAVRMYHMWHPPTIKSVSATEAGRRAVSFNRDIVYNDTTFVRNVDHWRHPYEEAPPVVSVVYATKNRPELLRESLQSVLIQSVQDFEIIVVDDGSDDDRTAKVVAEFEDQRIHYHRTESKGISAARNFALDVSRGQYTAVMDDDDLMLPTRLADQMAAVSEGAMGSVGSFANFSNETGELQLIVSKVPSIAQAAEKGGAPGHGTWLLETIAMRTIRYDESLTSGVDNNFFLRFLRAGYRVNHCGRPVLARRMHDLQVTATDASSQGDSAKQAFQFFTFGLSDWHKKKLSSEAEDLGYPASSGRDQMLEAVKPYLPDHLVTRNARVEIDPKASFSLRNYDGVPHRRILSKDGVYIKSEVLVANATYNDLLKLSRLGFKLEAQLDTDNREEISDHKSWIEDCLIDYAGTNGTGEVCEVLVKHEGRSAEEGSPLSSVYSVQVDDRPVKHLQIRDRNGSQGDGTAPWIVIGMTVEEFWA